MSNILNDSSKELMIARLTAEGSKSNELTFGLAYHIYEEFKSIDWKNSVDADGNKITKMQVMEELASSPSMPFNDAGCMRQINQSGKFVANGFHGDFGKCSGINFWKFNMIARARLCENDEDNLKAQVQMVEDVLSGKLAPGKVQKQINLIKAKNNEEGIRPMIKLFNQWSFKGIDPRFGSQWPGQIPCEIFVNCMYHYAPNEYVPVLSTMKAQKQDNELQKNNLVTMSSVEIVEQKPIELFKVLDPMSGGGSTNDVIEFMNEQGYNIEFSGFDLNPDSFESVSQYTGKSRNISEKNAVLEPWDIKENTLDMVFTDPPYLDQVGEKYMDNPFTESRESFYNAQRIIMEKSFAVLKSGGMYVMVLASSTQRSVDFENGEVFIDTVYECMKILEEVGFKPFNRIQAPLATEQFNASSITSVKKYERRNQLLGIARDIVIMKKP